jgi:hypothetical protein
MNNEQELLPMIYCEGKGADTQQINILFLNFDKLTILSECINPFDNENADLHFQDIQLCQFTERKEA